MQSWGTSSRFAYRNTDRQPSKSAILGLLAAAQGRQRSDPIEELLNLRFGVRCDQIGRQIRDFQTARSLDGVRTFPLTYRFYLTDSAFVAGVEGNADLLMALGDAVRKPAHPLYLGRRSCPPAHPLYLDVRPGTLEEELGAAPWQAADWYQEREGAEVDLEILRDAKPCEIASETVRDVPVSFDPNHRKYAMRSIVRERCRIPNPKSRRKGSEGRRSGHGPGLTMHSPMDWWAQV